MIILQLRKRLDVSDAPMYAHEWQRLPYILGESIWLSCKRRNLYAYLNAIRKSLF